MSLKANSFEYSYNITFQPQYYVDSYIKELKNWIL